MRCGCSRDRRANPGSACGKISQMCHPAAILVFTISIYCKTTWHHPRMLPRSSLKSCDGQLAQWSNGQVWKKQARDEMAPTHNSIQWPAMLGTWDKNEIKYNRVVTWQPLTIYQRVVNSIEFSRSFFHRIGLCQRSTRQSGSELRVFRHLSRPKHPKPRSRGSESCPFSYFLAVS